MKIILKKFKRKRPQFPKVNAVGKLHPEILKNWNDPELQYLEVEVDVKVLGTYYDNRYGNYYDKSYPVTYAVTKDDYYFGWYNNTKPYAKDVEDHGCSKEYISYKAGDWITVRGAVEFIGVLGWRFNDPNDDDMYDMQKTLKAEDGNAGRLHRLIRCRVVKNKGKKST